MSSNDTIKRMRDVVGFRAWFYREAFGTKQGEYVLGDLIKTFGYWEPSHTPGDPYETAFREGQRRVISRIIKFSNMQPSDIERISKMLAEQESKMGVPKLEDF